MKETNPNQPLLLKTATEIKGRPLVIAVYPEYIEYRPFATHETYRLSHDAAFTAAAQRKADLDRQERAMNKKVRRAAR
jgi:hypothetical protein